MSLEVLPINVNLRSYKFFTWRIIIYMILVIDIVYRGNMQLLNNAGVSWFCQLLFWIFKLIPFILICVGCWPLKFNLRCFVARWHLVELCSWFDFVLWKIILVTRTSVEGHLGSHVSLLRNGSRFYFWGFDILGFICCHSLEFDCWSVVVSWSRSIFSFENISILFWILGRFYRVWFILIFIGTLSDKRNLEKNFTLSLKLIILHSSQVWKGNQHNYCSLVEEHMCPDMKSWGLKDYNVSARIYILDEDRCWVQFGYSYSGQHKRSKMFLWLEDEGNDVFLNYTTITTSAQFAHAF